MIVSVLTSTCNRARFIPRLIEMYKNQTYPHEKMEWIILDDGETKVESLFLNSGLPNIRYESLSTKLPMGAKLNLLKSKANGEILVVMDDDDYYPPERIQTVIDAFDQHPRKKVAGCSKVYVYYTHLNEIYSTGPYHNKHALNCTLAWKSSYNTTHSYDDEEICAVESLFLENFTTPMIQMDTEKTILHIIHSTNSFNAIKAKENGTLGLLCKTSLTLEDFIKDDSLRQSFIGAY